MKIFKIFIVDDDPWYGEMLKYHLSLNPDFEVYLFENAKSCLNNLHINPDVISIDYNLPDFKGDVLYKKIRLQNPELPTIVISGQEDIRIALALLKKGVYDYIIKDENTKEILWNTILNIRENASLKHKVKDLEKQLETKYSFEKTIIGQSPAIKKVFSLIANAVKTNINISITGETGTGKELVAKAIHYNSNRKKKSFVAINMAAIPKTLAESELFGHEKGAFTGAISKKIGVFEYANGGTIFLDEIAELDLSLQVKLLRVLQEKEITRIGGNTPIKFDAHIITATHKDLTQEVKDGRFRKDLYYRIIGLPIDLPPLRERDNDVLILAKHFIKAFANENGLKLPDISSEAKDKLLQYSYPGNVRELRSVIDLAIVMSDGKIILPNDITFHSNPFQDEILMSNEKTLKAYNIEIIDFFLKKYNHNVVKVARKLDIGKSTIYNLIKSGEIKNPK